MINLKRNEWTAQIDPARGMLTKSLRIGDEKILFEEFPEVPELEGSPLLLPPNRTAGGTFEFEGKRYTLPITEPLYNNHLHGFLHKQTFEVLEQTESSVVAQYENHGEIFPFPFCVHTCYALTDKGYEQEIRITNIGETNMPLCFGLHTNFVEKDPIRVPLDKFCKEDANIIPTGVLEELDAQQQELTVGVCPDGRVIGGFYTSAGHTAQIGRIAYTVSEQFSHWILYNRGGDKGFVSVEPQCGSVNALNSGDHLIVLAPGQTETFTLSYTLI